MQLKLVVVLLLYYYCLLVVIFKTCLCHLKVLRFFLVQKTLLGLNAGIRALGMGGMGHLS